MNGERPRILTPEHERVIKEIAERQGASQQIVARYVKAAGYNGATPTDVLAVLCYRLHELERMLAMLANEAGLGDGTMPEDLYPETRVTEAPSIVLAGPGDMPKPKA